MLPAANAAEAAVVEGVEVIGAGSLKEVIGLLNGEREMTPAVPADGEPFGAESGRYEEDFADVKGQTHVKRALEIAAAGGHNVLMIGAPGSGKTMLARRMPTILPPLSREEALETTKIHSVAGNTAAGGLLARRPFRAPHHTISQAALIGGDSRRGSARCRWPITGCCSSTSCPNSGAACWRCCGSRWRRRG